jgi:hypothetical protein
LHGTALARSKVVGWPPAELIPYPRGVDGVARVVSGPVLDEGDQLPPLAQDRRSCELVDEVADGFDYIDVTPFRVAAGLGTGRHGDERLGVVVHIEPIKCRQTAEPMKPAPPVTITCMVGLIDTKDSHPPSRVPGGVGAWGLIQ